MWNPGHYRIVVDGWFDPAMRPLVAGLKISRVTSDGHPPVSTLEGEVADQSQLIGVLNALHDLHLPIVEVIVIE